MGGGGCTADGWQVGGETEGEAEALKTNSAYL